LTVNHIILTSQIIEATHGIYAQEWKERQTSASPVFPGRLYSDGITEACDGKKQFFGQSRLMSALNDAASNEPDQLQLHVDERIKLFVGEAPQYDDITLFCLRYNGKC
jgi:hypothetical protein